MITITMMQLRKEPGEYIDHLVGRHNETVIITKNGKPIAQLCPLESTTIDSKGRCHGPYPITKNRPELIKQPTEGEK